MGPLSLHMLAQGAVVAAETKALDKFMEYGVLGAVVVVLIVAFVAYWRHTQTREATLQAESKARITKLEATIEALQAERATAASAHGAAILAANAQAAAAMQTVRDAHARELATLQENRLREGQELSERLLQFTERSVSVLSETRNALDTQSEAFTELRTALRDIPARKPTR